MHLKTGLSNGVHVESIPDAAGPIEETTMQLRRSTSTRLALRVKMTICCVLLQRLDMSNCIFATSLDKLPTVSVWHVRPPTEMVQLTKLGFHVS